MNQLTLSWRDHNNVLISVFENLLEKKALVDCTLAAEGHFIKAHRIVLSGCSPYLENLLNQEIDKHPIIFLRDVKYPDLQALVTFMYSGIVQISEDRLVEFLSIAKSLQIKGLGDVKNKTKGNKHYCKESQQQKSSLPVSNKQICHDSSGVGDNSCNKNEITSNNLADASGAQCNEETRLDNLNTSNVTTLLHGGKLVCDELDNDEIKIEEEVMNCQSSCSEVSRDNHLDNIGVSSIDSIPLETVPAEYLCADVKEEVHIPEDVEQFVNYSIHNDADEEVAPRFEQVTCAEEFADDMYSEENSEPVLERNLVGNQHKRDEYSDSDVNECDSSEEMESDKRSDSAKESGSANEINKKSDEDLSPPRKKRKTDLESERKEKVLKEGSSMMTFKGALKMFKDAIAIAKTEAGCPEMIDVMESGFFMLTAKMDSLRPSIQYDVSERFKRTNSSLALGGMSPKLSLEEMKMSINLQHAFSDVANFEEFDTHIAKDKEKYKNCVDLMTALAFGAKNVTDAIDCILSELMTKELQLQYSGKGRIVKGKGKRNFSTTTICSTTLSIIMQKFGVTKDAAMSKISRWLSGAVDRDGGRKYRENKTL